jgi:hypothetical protein
MLISAGQNALDASFPIVARCDMYWPEHAADGANSNHQYIYLVRGNQFGIGTL